MDANRRKGWVPVGDLVNGALRDLGVSSRTVTRRVLAAWDRVADPAWAQEARPLRLAAGILVVGVRSASLRQELAQFHRARLLDVLRAACPDLPLVDLRFSADWHGDAR